MKHCHTLFNAYINDPLLPLGPQAPGGPNRLSDRKLLVCRPPQTACRTASSLPNRPAGDTNCLSDRKLLAKPPRGGRKPPFGPQAPYQTAPRGDANRLSDRKLLGKPPRGGTQTAFRTASSLPNRPAGGEGAPRPPPHAPPSRPARLLPRAGSRFPGPPAGAPRPPPHAPSRPKRLLPRAVSRLPRPSSLANRPARGTQTAFRAASSLPNRPADGEGAPRPPPHAPPSKPARLLPRAGSRFPGRLRPLRATRAAWGSPGLPVAIQNRLGPARAAKPPGAAQGLQGRLGPSRAAWGFLLPIYLRLSRTA